MNTVPVPTRDQVSPANQALFDPLRQGLCRVPHGCATPASSEHPLGDHLAFPNANNSITGQAREVVNRVVSQVNGYPDGLAARIEIGGIGDKTVTNCLHASTKLPVDFPAAPAP